MAKRDNHYEAAFEAYLRQRGIPYIAVDEKRRSVLGGTDPSGNPNRSLKSLDFIVSPLAGGTWLVDIKGRHFPSGKQKQFWKNWSTRDDLESLRRWEMLMGVHAAGLFVFAYEVLGDQAPLPAEQLFPFRDKLYGFVGIRLSHYGRHAKTLSPKWGTVHMSIPTFREFATGVDWFFERPLVIPQADPQLASLGAFE